MQFYLHSGGLQMDNSPKIEKYPDIEYVLHIYDTIWDYYKKTLDERTQLLNNYIVFVGIPISAVGIIAERLGENIANFIQEIIGILILILLIGIVIFLMYIKESAVSRKYLTRIEVITDFLIERYDSDSDGLFSRLYGLDDLFHPETTAMNIRLGKGLILPIINSGILVGIFYLLTAYHLNAAQMALIFVISLAIQIIVFVVVYRTPDRGKR